MLIVFGLRLRVFIGFLAVGFIDCDSKPSLISLTSKLCLLNVVCIAVDPATDSEAVRVLRALLKGF